METKYWIWNEESWVRARSVAELTVCDFGSGIHSSSLRFHIYKKEVITDLHVSGGRYGIRGGDRFKNTFERCLYR